MRTALGSVLVLVLFAAPAAAQTLAIPVGGAATPGPIELLQAPQPVETPEERREDVHPFVGYSAWVEQMRLDQVHLTLSTPEIAAVRGLELRQGWAGAAALRDQVVGGGSLAIGMRAYQYIRGPELRLMVGGGETNGPWAATDIEGIDVNVRSIVMFRAELAAGVQLPLGPVVPYVLGRAAVMAASLDVGVREARLGELGVENVGFESFELGMEAGLGFRVLPGIEIGLAFRASFLGTETMGGMLTLGIDGSTFEP